MKWVKCAAMGLAAAVVLVGLQLVYALYAPVAEPWPVAQSPETDTVDFRHYPYSQAVFAFLAELEQQFPELMDLATIGQSHRGRPIVMCQITNRVTGSALSKPAVLITAQLHAREPIAGQTALYAIKHLLENYGSDQLVTHLLDTRTVYIAPLVNPDGNDLFLSQDEQLRTNARPTDIDQDGKYDEDPRTHGLNSCCRTIISFKPYWMLRTKGKPWSEKWPYDSEEGRYSNIRWTKEEWVTWRNKPILRCRIVMVTAGLARIRWQGWISIATGMPNGSTALTMLYRPYIEVPVFFPSPRFGLFATLCYLTPILSWQ